MANQKGGVGKTTTAINLGTALAGTGQKFLIVDLDPQGNASTGVGVEARDRHITSYEVLTGTATLGEAQIQTAVPGLTLIPSTVDLSGVEFELATDRHRSHRLARALEQFPLSPTGRPLDFVLIDCPPSLNVLTINAMVASHSALVPLQCEFFALEGLSQLMRTIELVRTNLNPHLEIEGVVLTMYDRRNKLSAQVEQDVRAFLGDKVYRTKIPRNVRISEAPSHGKPAIIYDHRCAGSIAYMKLAGEVIQTQKQRLAA
ncbi:MAG: ParA family protein [Pseudomonadota bacterium]